MVVAVLLMIVSGIGLIQAVSDPAQVTLRWLRLGGVIALSLLAVAAVVTQMAPRQDDLPLGLWVGYVAVVFAIQLLAVQKGYRSTQRVAAVVGCFTASAFTWLLLFGAAISSPSVRYETHAALTWWLAATAPVSAGLLGGFLMTMLLGHAYLTAGNEMTQAPFRRLVLVLAVLLGLRATVASIFGLWPYLAGSEVAAMERMWNTVMIAARYAVGLAVPGVFVYMVYDCVQRRSNQSATGILYVASVLIILGEGIAMSLMSSTGCVF